MIRNLKAFGLALVAVFAMGAMVTSAAQAQGVAKVTAEATTVTLDGKQIGTSNVFQREARKVSCTAVELQAHDTNFNGDSTILTTAPVFTGCEETVLKKSSTVFMNGCTFTFHLTGDATGGEHTWTATTDLECPGAPARLVVYNATGDSAPASDHEESDRLCEYTFASQTGLSKIDLTNKAAGGVVGGVVTPKDYIIADITVGGITSVRTFGAALTCGAVNNATATLTAEAEIWGTNGLGEKTGVTIST